MLCGTNVFAIGFDGHYYMVDACTKGAEKFLENLTTFVMDKDATFEGILITHAHHDHMDGA